MTSQGRHVSLSQARSAWTQPAWPCPELCDQPEIAVTVAGQSAAGRSAAGIVQCDVQFGLSKASVAWEPRSKLQLETAAVGRKKNC